MRNDTQDSKPMFLKLEAIISKPGAKEDELKHSNRTCRLLDRKITADLASKTMRKRTVLRNSQTAPHTVDAASQSKVAKRSMVRGTANRLFCSTPDSVPCRKQEIPEARRKKGSVKKYVV